MLGVGALVASWVSWGTYRNLKGSSAQWRVPLGLQIFPAVILAALILLFPESPRYVDAPFTTLTTDTDEDTDGSLITVRPKKDTKFWHNCMRMAT